VKDGWQFVLNETAVHFLLSLRTRERERLLSALEKLANDPMQKGNFQASDTAGRTIQISVAGNFLISYWPDALIKELRVINIEHI
jgi:hypothetical protein